MVVVKLFAYFRDNRGKVIEMEYTPQLKIIDIVRTLGIDENKVAISLVNGTHQPLETEVNDGENIYLFPPVAGG